MPNIAASWPVVYDKRPVLPVDWIWPQEPDTVSIHLYYCFRYIFWSICI